MDKNRNIVSNAVVYLHSLLHGFPGQRDVCQNWELSPRIAGFQQYKLYPASLNIKKNENKNKHNAELQWADPGTKVSG